MSLSWNVCRLRESDATISIESNAVDAREKREWSINYQAIAEGISDPLEVTEISAMRAPGVPRLRYNVYVDPDGTVFPYFSCKNKTATRNTENPFMFHIACQYTDDEGEDGEEPQADPEDYTPSIRWDVKSRQRTAWQDVNGKPYMLPTGSKFKSGLKIDYPCLTATVTQIENSFNKTDLKNRMLTVNDDSWQGIRAGAALITAISYEEIQVPVGAAGVITGYTTAYRVQYSIEENTLNVTGATNPQDQTSTPALRAQRFTDNTQTNEVDWRVFRPLIDSVVRAEGRNGKIVPARALGASVTNVYLTEYGWLRHAPNKNNFADTPPPITSFDIYESMDFSSFLRI